MTRKKLAAVTIVTVIGLTACSGLQAQQPISPAQSGEPTDLYRRLEAAEQQISHLQNELYRTQTARSESTGLYYYSSFADEEESEAETDVEEQLDELKSSVKELQDANDDIESALKSFVNVGTSNASIKFFGRLHGDYWAFPGADPGIDAFEGRDPEDRFAWRRIRIGVGGNITDHMIYKFETEFADPNDTEWRDVYLGFTDLPFLQLVLIGNQKRPYGLDHLNSSRYNVFMERPFIIEAFNEDARRLGICSYGVSEDERWNWRYGVYNLERIQDDGAYIGDHYQPQIAGRLANTIWYDDYSNGRAYAHWAIAGTIAYPDGIDQGGETNSNEARFRTRPEARSDTRWLNTDRIAFADDYELAGLEGLVNLGPFQVCGEYQYTWMNRTNALTDLQFGGGYAYVSYFLTGEHIPWELDSGTLGRVKPFENFFLVDTCDGSRGGGWGAWQIAVRWSYADLTDEDITGGVGESVTFGLNWHWNSNARMQFNYLYGHIDERGPIDGFTAGDYSIIGTRLMVDF